MKKITLYQNEEIKHPIKFSIRIFLLDILFIIFILSMATKLTKELGNLGTFVTIILMILFILLAIKTLFDFLRIFFHRAYITNQRLIYVKGYYYKSIRSYSLNDIIGVYFKSSRFDRHKNMSTFKVTMKDGKEVILKNVKDGAYIAELLSSNLVKMHKKNELK